MARIRRLRAALRIQRGSRVRRWRRDLLPGRAEVEAKAWLSAGVRRKSFQTI